MRCCMEWDPTASLRRFHALLSCGSYWGLFVSCLTLQNRMEKKMSKSKSRIRDGRVPKTVLVGWAAISSGPVVFQPSNRMGGTPIMKWMKVKR
ncbi:uncharacterized protein BT62DRAFT_25523 [Guyanagaster necrorhizus]|uniref:Uncharacterized protein n=1 Tax=Guyanagaster necrorhizus TaxID=856835 RepID=A0A9P7W525_9AGAR|nr:uncharacterized protein BT62DRAFT_25523 [Guyanagaster necrorhizus MCA 3950]KAG7452762.1 hypothetical protein BT62DRAFT_25523 [Guyanagaster necrorhizus MCA 3950]